MSPVLNLSISAGGGVLPNPHQQHQIITQTVQAHLLAGVFMRRNARCKYSLCGLGTMSVLVARCVFVYSLSLFIECNIISQLYLTPMPAHANQNWWPNTKYLKICNLRVVMQQLSLSSYLFQGFQHLFSVLFLHFWASFQLIRIILSRVIAEISLYCVIGSCNFNWTSMLICIKTQNCHSCKPKLGKGSYFDALGRCYS